MPAASSRPTNVGDLLSKSIYYAMLDDSEKAEAEKYLMPLDGGSETPLGERITNVGGKVKYFNYQINPSVGYYAETDTSGTHHLGDFVEVKLNSGKTAYVHYSCLYVPNPEMIKKIGFMNIIYGILFQNMHTQMSQLQDLVAEATILNRKIAKLTSLYQKFIVLQAIGFQKESDGTDSMTEVGFDVLDEFTRFGLPYPFSRAKRGIIPSIYRVNGVERTWVLSPGGVKQNSSDYNYEHVYMVCMDGDNFTARRIYANVAKGEASYPTPPSIDIEKIKDLIVNDPNLKRQFTTCGGVLKYTNLMLDYDENMESEKKHFTFDLAVDNEDKDRTTDVITITYTLYVPHHSNETNTWTFVKSGDSKTKDKMDEKLPLKASYTPFTELAMTLDTKYGNHILATVADMRDFCDYMRLTSDTLSSTLSTVTNMISTLVNETQQAFSAASNIIAKLGDTWKKSAPQ